MSISETRLKHNLLYLLGGTVFLALFGGVYEQFSHGVYSSFMIYAFAIPLVLGALPYALALYRQRYPGRAFLGIWNAGIAVLSVGSVMRGVLDIYGTTNALIVVYPVAGCILLTLGVLLLICGWLRAKALG